jgi:hypothetical protein
MSDSDFSTSNKDPVITKSPPALPQDSSSWNLLKTFRSLRIPVDENGQAWTLPVILVDPASPGMHPTGIRGQLDQGSAPLYGPQVYSVQQLYNESTSPPSLEFQRTPTIFKFLEDRTTSGAQTVWTPTAGKRFRLLGGIITVSKDAACAGALILALYDSATQFTSYIVSHAALVAIGNVVLIPISFKGNGYLSSAINNVLNVNFSGALTAGGISISVWGTEE